MCFIHIFPCLTCSSTAWQESLTISLNKSGAKQWTVYAIKIMIQEGGPGPRPGTTVVGTGWLRRRTSWGCIVERSEVAAANAPSSATIGAPVEVGQGRRTRRDRTNAASQAELLRDLPLRRRGWWEEAVMDASCSGAGDGGGTTCRRPFSPSRLRTEAHRSSTTVSNRWIQRLALRSTAIDGALAGGRGRQRGSRQRLANGGGGTNPRQRGG